MHMIIKSTIFLPATMASDWTAHDLGRIAA
jgi:hypothetical protein